MLKSQYRAWAVWFIVSIFFAYQNVLRVMPNVMLGEIMEQFHIDAGIFGQLSGVYYIAYSLMHIPIGLMLDRFGPKYVLPSCIMLAAIGLTPILFAEHWGYAMLGRALLGMGSSAGILGTFKIIRMTFDEKNFSKMLGFSVLIGLLGSIYGGGPMSQLCHLWGYRAVIELFALAGVVLAVVTYGVMPRLQEHAQGTIGADLKTVLTNPMVLLACFSSGLMVGPLEGFADVWGSTYLREMYGMDLSTASYITSLIFIGMCVGSLILPALADATQKHLSVIIVAGVIMLVSFAALLLGALNHPTMIGVGFFVIGVGCAYQIVAVYKATTYVRENVVGLTTAVTNMIVMSFGYTFHASIGSIVQGCGGAQAPHALTYGISTIPVALGLGVFGFLVLAHCDRVKRLKVKL